MQVFVNLNYRISLLLIRTSLLIWLLLCVAKCFTCLLFRWYGLNHGPVTGTVRRGWVFVKTDYLSSVKNVSMQK